MMSDQNYLFSVMIRDQYNLGKLIRQERKLVQIVYAGNDWNDKLISTICYIYTFCFLK